MEELDQNQEYIAWITTMQTSALFRIYDTLLTLIAGLIGAEEAKKLQQLHEEDKYLYPPPYQNQNENGTQ